MTIDGWIPAISFLSSLSHSPSFSLRSHFLLCPVTNAQQIIEKKSQSYESWAEENIFSMIENSFFFSFPFLFFLVTFSGLRERPWGTKRDDVPEKVIIQRPHNPKISFLFLAFLFPLFLINNYILGQILYYSITN